MLAFIRCCIVKVPPELVEYYAKKQGLAIRDPEVYVNSLAARDGFALP